MDTRQQAEALPAKQYGVITARQAAACGMTADHIAGVNVEGPEKRSSLDLALIAVGVGVLLLAGTTGSFLPGWISAVLAIGAAMQ